LKRGWSIAAGIFLVLFAGTIYLSVKLPLLDALGPGPGFFPLILALLGAVLSLALIIQLSRQPAASFNEDAALVPDRSATFRLVGIVVLLVAAFSSLDPLGDLLTALLFSALLLLVVGVRNDLAIALVSLVLSFGVFHSFYYWLKVPLPIGGLGL